MQILRKKKKKKKLDKASASISIYKQPEAQKGGRNGGPETRREIHEDDAGAGNVSE
jgi:hypothetical protein